MLAVVCPFFLKAQPGQQQNDDVKPLSPVSRTYAVVNANIIQAPGRTIDRGTVVVKDGLIHAVGKNVPIPPEAIIIRADSMYVYAGFIDGLSRAGVIRPKEEQNRERPKDPGNPTPQEAGITPEKDVRWFLNPQDKTVDELRALGFTTVHAVPYGGMLSGMGAIINLSGETADEMILASKSSLYTELTGARRMYPSTVMGVMAKWRELYKQAIQAKNYEALYASNPNGLTRPEANKVLEAFYPVIDRRMPVMFEADQYLEIHRILSMQRDLGFSLMLGNIREGWEAIGKIKSSGAKVFLSLELPEDRQAKKDAGKKDKSIQTLSPAEKEALEKRQAEWLALYNGQAAAFQKAGVPFGFSSLSVKTKDIRPNLRKMIAAGLTEDQALTALTSGAAQLLGLSDRLGTVDQGKIANLVVCDKPYFSEKSNVRYVFVDGTLYSYEVKEAPRTDPQVIADIVGTWTVIMAAAQRRFEETVTFEKSGDRYTGTVKGGRLQQPVPLDAVELSGKTLRYSYSVPEEGKSLKINVEVTVDGPLFKGKSAADDASDYTVEGKKNPSGR